MKILKRDPADNYMLYVPYTISLGCSFMVSTVSGFDNILTYERNQKLFHTKLYVVRIINENS